MTNERRGAEDIFDAALDLPAANRSAFLDDACGDNADLRDEVDRLLADHEALGSFLQTPFAAPAGSAPAAEDAFDPEPTGAVAAGTKFGRYMVIAPLGAGGMGSVYRARDERLERDVAIKILTPGVLTGEDWRRRFRKEALALAKLGDAHIAAVYDVGEQDGIDYIVMECVAGQTLAALLKNGPLRLKEATTILLQIASALDEAHEQGVVHRDLKPANVMITAKGQVKVLDFGIAKLLSARPADGTATMETGAAIGTPLYMSPEQAKAETIDARTDLWSLGVIYYEALTGQRPFAGKSSVEVLYSVICNPPLPAAALSGSAERIIQRSLEKDRIRRYQSAREVMQDASELLTELSGPVDAGRTSRTRWQPIGWAVAATLLVAITAGGWLYHRSNLRRWARDQAIPQATELFAARKPVAAFAVIEQAKSYLPDEATISQFADEHSRSISIASTPAGATVAIRTTTHRKAPGAASG